jgi:hypothetical protein
MTKTARTAAITASVVLCLAAGAFAADEPEDWYTWYENQNKAAAEQGYADYSQDYETISPDTYVDPYYQDDYNAVQDGQTTNPNGDTQDPSEPTWTWGEEDPAPDQTQPDAQPPDLSGDDPNTPQN